MEIKTERFEAETLVNGLDIYDLDLVPEFGFSDDIYNLSCARAKGMGPRYGMAPIPNHSHTNLESSYGGLRGSEGATANYPNRKRVWGVLPLSIGTYADIKINRKHWVWVCGSEQGGVQTFDFCPAVNTSGQHTADIGAYLRFDPVSGHSDVNARYRLLRPSPVQFRTISNSRTYVSSTIFQHSGSSKQKAWWAGYDDPAYPDTANRFALPSMGEAVSGTVAFGHPPAFNFGGWKEGIRNILAYSIGGTGLTDTIYDMMARWSQSVTVNNSSYLPTINSAAGTNLATTWPNATRTGRDDGVVGTVGTSTVTVIYDPDLQCSSNYNILMSAPGKAIAAIIHEHERNPSPLPTLLKWFDLTAPIPSLKVVGTAGQGLGGVAYTDQSRVTQTSWELWASTTYAGTTATLAAIEAANQRDGTRHVALGASGSGLLRGYTIYEVGLAVYDYTLDYESNVGVPARIYTGQDDGVCLYLFLQATATGGTPNPGVNNFKQKAGLGYTSIPFPTTDTELLRRINYLQYRVYYRELGTFEWLPAGAIDMTELYYNPDLIEFAVCRGPIAALPGGQPGAFSDYSPLPPDQWEDVTVFNKRSFWLSKRQICYSLTNNPLAYPARNSISCPKGEFRGFKVHLFTGQSEQLGRLMIFGSEETYYAEFSGQPLLQPVRVSADVVGQYPVDGSDLEVRLRSTITAFSGRSAVSAEGLLFFWGPQGIFVDNGVDLPKRISEMLEPDLFTWYNNNDTDNIHAAYNANTKEVLFFFTPSAEKGTEPTHCLVYNQFGKWHYWKFKCKIDWSQQVTIDNQSTARLVNGNRMMIGVRENASGVISRAVFFDQLCNSGDFGYGDEILIRDILAAGLPTYRFRLAAGYSVAAFTALQPGDIVTAPSMREYLENTSGINAAFVVTAKGADYFDATDPTGSAWIGVTPTRDKYFPAYFQRTHAIPWTLESNQWAPGGLKNFYCWYFMHLMFIAELLSSASAQTIVLEHRTNVNSGYQARTLTIVNNSRGYFQVLSQVVPTDMAHFGQSIQMRLTGNHLGGLLALQYFAVEGEKLPLTETQIFEG